MKQKAAYLGPEGTFTQEAAEYLLPAASYAFIPYKSIPDVLCAVRDEQVQLGVVPVENTIEGSVNLTLDWLAHQVEIPVTGELVYPISQHLLVHPFHKNREWSEYRKVISHPQAVAQCQMFLRHHLDQTEIEYANSTAEAAHILSENPDQPWIAIGTRLAQQIYHLEMRQESIEDHEQNVTRFITVGAQPQDVTQNLYTGVKTSLLVTLPEDFPGALHQVLAVFAWRKINLTRIESRPTKTGLGNYLFFIDVQMGTDDLLLQGAMSEIEALGCHLRKLGSYACYTFSPNCQSLQR